MPSLLMVSTVLNTLVGFLAPFAAHFRARGWRVDALASGASIVPGGEQAFDRVWDMKWSRIPLHPHNLMTAPMRVHEIVAREGYDLVHVHTPVAAFVTRLGLRHLRKQGKPRLLYTAHGFHFYQGGPRLKGAMFRLLERLAGRWTDYLVVINREDEQAALRYGIVPPDRVRYMPGIGVDTQHYSSRAVSEADVLRVRQELGLGNADRLFLMVAEFIPRKRHRDVLHAFARLERPEACLAFAGHGPLLEEMKQLAASLGIAERVRFLGYRHDIPALIQSSVATLLSSAQEGLPRSIMESLCQAVPAIGSRIRGVTDLLEDRCGLLVPVGDVQGFAKAMAWVLDHPEPARLLGERGREAMAAYDLRHIVKLHEELYDEALGTVVHGAPAGGTRASLVW